MLPAKPCLPTSAPSPPVGPEWLHEIKHDGYRMLALRDGERVRLLSRRGLDWGGRFPTIVAAVKALAMTPARSSSEHACKLGCEGIVSKRRGRAMRSAGRAAGLKVKNPAALAVQREAEEDWFGPS